MTSVLVVDDEAVLLMVIARLLQMKNYKVYTASNVAEALELAGQHRPDVLITDYNLNESLTGLDLCRAFVQDPLLVSSRRIIVSAEAIELDGLGHLYERLLSKPFTSNELLGVLQPDARLDTPPWSAVTPWVSPANY